ncbi:ABC-2 family transporter protein [Actinomyces denticolens]|uniref:ABC transporter permease n=1 Tax=Actinomyces TaxID=1654 RepID=UPI0009820BC1|nr:MULTISPECIES: ABC transporter permease [Actinomyces]SUU74291.1 ABC-2 family transporter protein [Actinomyces denticolens]
MILVRAEVKKLCTLTSIWIATASCILLPVGLAALSAHTMYRALSAGRKGEMLSSSTADAGFGHLIFGAIGVVVIGVIAMSSEYTRNAQKVGRSRQLTTTMIAAPRRFQTVISKIIALCLWVVATSAVAATITIAVSRQMLGEYAAPLDGTYWRRVAGVSVFWVMMALISCAFTAATRNGVLPLVILLANSTVLSFSRLLALVTDLAKYLPDTAALSMFLVESPVENAVGAATGFYVCTAWGLLAAAIIIVSWVMRDAQS